MKIVKINVPTWSILVGPVTYVGLLCIKCAVVIIHKGIYTACSYIHTNITSILYIQEFQVAMPWYTIKTNSVNLINTEFKMAVQESITSYAT